jgi:hypothetical protein
MVRLEHKVLRDLKVIPVLPVRQVLMVPPEQIVPFPVLLDHKVFKEFRVLLVLRVHKVFKVPLDLRVLLLLWQRQVLLQRV